MRFFHISERSRSTINPVGHDRDHLYATFAVVRGLQDPDRTDPIWQTCMQERCHTCPIGFRFGMAFPIDLILR